MEVAISHPYIVTLGPLTQLWPKMSLARTGYLRPNHDAIAWFVVLG